MPPACASRLSRSMTSRNSSTRWSRNPIFGRAASFGSAMSILSRTRSPADWSRSRRGLQKWSNGVMTSATLAVGRADLAYFRERIGATEAEPLQLGSPFDFQKQMKMFVVKKMPDPRDATYQKELERWIAHFVEKTDGCAFVLFTSYRDMQQVAGEMQKFFVEKKMNLLVQGGGAPRSRSEEHTS